MKGCIHKLLSGDIAKLPASVLKECGKFLWKLEINLRLRNAICLSSAHRLPLTLSLSISIKNFSQRWLLKQSSILMKTLIRVILVLRKLQEDPSLSPFWSKEFASKRLFHMPDLNNNQRCLKTQKLLFLILNLNLKLKEIMLRLELIILKNSKKLLMLNGTLYMKNLIKLLNQAQILYFQAYLLEILLLNISQTEACFVLDVFRKTIFKE